MTDFNQQPERRELVIAAVITLAGFAMRFAFLSEVAVEHFDEGVYASNLLFPDSGYEYPDRFLYAPPLLPSAIEWSTILLGTAPWVPLLPALILGSLTVPLLWWTVRNWFNPGAGVAAASFCAFSEFHIAMSRSALTDAPLVFFLLLSVFLILEAIVTERLGIATAGGFAAGLAWATKYNGWLSLAIVTSGTVAAFVLDALLRRTVQRRARFDQQLQDEENSIDTAPLIRLGAIARVIAVVLLAAAITWVPVWQDIDEHGGYSRVSGNHAKYFAGLSGWVDGAIRHVVIQGHYAGTLTWLGSIVAVAAGVVVMRRERFTWNTDPCSIGDPSHEVGDGPTGSTWNMTQICFLFLRAAPLVSVIILVPLAGPLCLSTLGFAIAQGSLMFDRLPFRDGHSNDELRLQVLRRLLGSCLGLAWFLGLLVATPLYRPYPRLLLPLMCVLWIGSGLFVSQHVFSIPRHSKSLKPSLPALSRGRIALSVSVLGLLMFLSLAFGGLNAWQQRDGLMLASRRLATDVAADCQGEYSEIEDVDFVIYVFGEPALLHHLSDAHPRIHVRAAMSLSFARPDREHADVPTYLAAGPHARRNEDFARQREHLGKRLKPVGVYPWQPSSFVLLDDMAPSQIKDSGGEEIRLYRVQFDES